MPPRPPSREVVEKAVEAYHRCGSYRLAARDLNLSFATIYNWVWDIGPRLYGTKRPEPLATPPAKGRREIEIENGVLFVCADAHYWPGEPSTAHRALVRFLKREKNLSALIMNGDAYDFSSISRHPPIGWQHLPTVQEELDIVEERMMELVKASGKAKRFFPLGNHDARFSTFIAKHTPELKGVKGTSLVDHTNPLWEPCWSLYINNRPGGLVIKHRFKGGIASYVPHNNTLWAGRSMATGHLHSQRVVPFTDLNGTRWGVDVGCLADVYAPAFQDYIEDNPRNWVSGFARFKFVQGRLLTPELVRVVEPGVVEFRGELIEV